MAYSCPSLHRNNYRVALPLIAFIIYFVGVNRLSAEG